MESFYGGRQGYSFVLKDKFKSVADMKKAFALGEGYSGAKFGEYVIIETEDKNDKENGCVYRRGYNYSDENNGAIYVGQICGPAGPAPTIDISKTYDDIEKRNFEDDTNLDEKSTKQTLTIGNHNFVSGKDSDAIELISINQADENGIQTTTFIGAKVPYPEFTFEGGESLGYKVKNTQITKKQKDESNKDYKILDNHYIIQVPRGIPGQSLTEISYDSTNGKIVYTLSRYDESKRTDVNNSFTAGRVKSISSFTKGDNGVYTMEYANSGINPEDKGYFEPNTFTIKEIDSFTLGKDGLLTAKYIGGDDQEIGKLALNPILNINNYYFYDQEDFNAPVMGTDPFSDGKLMAGRLNENSKNENSPIKKGGIIGISEKKGSDVYFYGYSGDIESWVYLGCIEAKINDDKPAAIIRPLDLTMYTDNVLKEILPENGVCFFYE